MNCQLDNQPTREAIAKEFGADAERLHLAESSIRDIAKHETEIDRSRSEFDGGEVAYFLNEWGLVEVFALYCLRLKRSRGTANFFISELSCIFRVDAIFDPSGRLKTMVGKVRYDEPLGLGIDTLPLRDGDELFSEAWRQERQKEIEHFLAEECGLPYDVLSVIRYPLSQVQAYRKFLGERWYDPDVPSSERFGCPIDRACLDQYLQRADTALERFEVALTEIDNGQS